MAEHKTRELYVEMPDNSQLRNDALKEAKVACEKYKTECEIAKHIKQHFDDKHGPNWHVIVGKQFYAYNSYEAKSYIFFYEGPLAILLYKLT
mmetsp:Transcript_95922/g.133183  ORF Transcript_95922/g.133183 Transcript_95922/m.133183 type:complete len:92 (-) Transcript_95922:16-291(-)